MEASHLQRPGVAAVNRVRRWGTVGAVSLGALLGVFEIAIDAEPLVESAANAPSADPAARAAADALAQLPVAFVPNHGQWDPAARLVARFGASTVFLEDAGWTMSLAPPGDVAEARGAAMRMCFAGAAGGELVPERPLGGRHHYLCGDDASRWRTDVPRFGAVRYRSVYRGIDVLAYQKDGHFEYDVELAPGADLQRFEIAVDGADGLEIDADGALVIDTAAGPVRQPAPVTYEVDAAGHRRPVASRCELRGPNRFGFTVPEWDGDVALVLDPGLIYATYLGGSVADQAVAVTVDATGAATVAGVTLSPDFPATMGAFDPTLNSQSDWDGFIARLSPDGDALVYATFLGGSLTDQVRAMATDSAGAAVVVGETRSTDFPTTPGAFDRTHAGIVDGFVTKLSPDGSSLVFSTFLGGTTGSQPWGVAVDANGAATVVGQAASGYPTTPGAYDRSLGGASDGFVTKLALDGSNLVYSTFLGGTTSGGGRGFDAAYAVSLDARGAAIVVGSTISTDFPTTPGAFDTTFNSANPWADWDGFVTQLSPDGSSLVFSTFLGGASHDDVSDCRVDGIGAITVTGTTSSANFPVTPGAFDTTFDTGDGFVARLSPSGAQLDYGTFLAGSPISVCVDARGAAIVVGSPRPSFPTTGGAFDTTFHNGDGFVARLSPSAADLEYSSFMTAGIPRAVHVDAAGRATMAGPTGPGFPVTPGAFDTTYDGGESFVARLDLLPTGTRAFGDSSPGCTGPLAIGVTSWPQAGTTGFAITCGSAPPAANGALLVASASLESSGPLALLGVRVWVDPNAAFFLGAAARSDAAGAARLGLPVLAAWIGSPFYAQWVWLGPTSPAPCPALGLSTSNALEVIVQP